MPAITESCCCGAQFIYTGGFADTSANYFRKTHEPCRQAWAASLARRADVPTKEGESDG